MCDAFRGRGVRPIRTIRVQGEGAQAWLAALTLARFVVAEPSAIVVEALDASPARRWQLRPSSGKLHAALGLNPKALGTEIGEADYAAQLQDIARSAGIRTDEGDESRVCDLVVETDRAEAIWTNNRVAVGMAAIPTELPERFGIHILHATLMALVGAFPDAALEPVETAEYARRVAALRPAMGDMEALLTGAEPSETLRHRLRVWKGTGRVIPVDHDPFGAEEWKEAMRAAGVAPLGRSLLEAVRG